jgi:hypothetical protein
LKENIKLPIRETFEGVIESKNNGKKIEKHIYNKLQISIRFDKPARSRRLPIKYREK